MKHFTSPVVGLAALTLLGCTGNVLGGGGDEVGGYVGPGSGAPGSAGTGSGSSAGAGAGSGASGALPAPSLRLLTRTQYRATLASLFPFAGELELELEDDAIFNGLRAIGASNVALSPKATEAYQAAALEAASRAFADVATGTAFAGCNVAEPACASGFIADFGRRAFRRSLAADEQARFLSIYQAGVQKLGDGAVGLKYAVRAILGSPHFLYRAELGVPGAAGTPRRLSDVQVASKLAYFLSNGPPDAELLKLAESGGLQAAGALAAQAARLLGASSLQHGMESLFDDYLDLASVSSLEKVPSAFPAFTPTLALAMRQETLLGLSRAASSQVDFRSVFNSNKTFVNQELAQLYGISGVSGSAFVEVELPAASGRRGLLGQASLLSVNAHAAVSSPTLRGKFVRQVLLCQGIPAPPPNVDTTLPDASEAATARERFTVHRTDPNCSGCHQLMDPIGLGLENFDAIGQYRATENGQTIDASGELDGSAFQSPAQLADALSRHPGLPTCLSRTVFRYAWGRLESPADEAFVGALTAAFAGDQYRLTGLLSGAVNAPEFVNVGEVD